MAGSFLELMGATAGALALVDRLVENPVSPGGRIVKHGDVFISYLEPATREMRELHNRDLKTAIREARSLHASGKIGVTVYRIGASGEGVAVWYADDEGEFEMKENPVIRDRYGASVARGQNLRVLFDYVRNNNVFVERVDLFGPNKFGGGTLGVTFSNGATTLVDFVDFGVMKKWVDQRTKGKRALFGAAEIKHAPPVVLKTNPRGRSKGSITRKSQVTGKPPTKRLIARRMKNARAPKGFFANPDQLPVYFGIHLNAGNDRNGNPRRAIVFMRHNGKDASVVKVVNEGFQGVSGAIQAAGLDPRTTPVIGRFDITPSQYRNVLKMAPGVAY